MTVLLLLAIALPFSAGTAFAATNITNGTSSQTNTTTSNNLAKVTDQNSTPTTNVTETTNKVNTTENNTQAKTVTPTTTKANSSSTNKAAGSAASASTVKTATSTSFTNTEITSAAASVQSFVITNGRLPNYVTISNTEVTMPEFLQLLVNDLLNYNSKINTPVTLKTVTDPTNPAEVLKIGNILKSQYLSLADSIEKTIASTGKTPSEINTSLGTINFDNLVYSFSKVLNFEGTTQRLPNYVSVEPWSQVIKNTATSEGSGSSMPAALLPYLQPTTNAQSNNPTIVALANKITAGLTTPYSKAVAIFDWVRNNITYSFYYNTKYGAVGTLAAGTGNCCDHSNLVVALARAAGIPARYQQGYCDFSDGWYGHVWAQLYVNGKWYYADTISTANTFGTITNWNLNTYTLEGTFITLPF
ncbi:MAG: transglutaminase domain-containing protein [Methanobacterium sp.]